MEKSNEVYHKIANSYRTISKGEIDGKSIFLDKIIETDFDLLNHEQDLSTEELQRLNILRETTHGIYTRRIEKSYYKIFPIE